MTNRQPIRLRRRARVVHFPLVPRFIHLFKAIFVAWKPQYIGDAVKTLENHVQKFDKTTYATTHYQPLLNSWAMRRSCMGNLFFLKINFQLFFFIVVNEKK